MAGQYRWFQVKEHVARKTLWIMICISKKEFTSLSTTMCSWRQKQNFLERLNVEMFTQNQPNFQPKLSSPQMVPDWTLWQLAFMGEMKGPLWMCESSMLVHLQTWQFRLKILQKQVKTKRKGNTIPECSILNEQPLSLWYWELNEWMNDKISQHCNTQWKYQIIYYIETPLSVAGYLLQEPSSFIEATHYG